KDLSGGEKQRIGILRAIIANPKVLLMDEPFSALDPISKGQLQDLIKDLHEEFKMTTVFVTHDMNEAVKLADRICLMRAGEVVQLGTPDELRNQPA
ncbi:ATP-binding cassette domain-containing protein, partial [Streptococcus suis]